MQDVAKDSMLTGWPKRGHSTEGKRSGRLKIGFIVPSHYPNDARVEREARLLTEVGYQVHVLCGRWASQTDRETIEQVEIHRLDLPDGLGSRFNYTVYKLSLIDLFWVWQIHRFVKQNDVQVIHVQHNLPLVPAALVVGKWCHLPVVFDIHDSYPDAILAWNLEMSWSERLFLNVGRMRWLEKTCAHLVDGLVIAVNDYRDLFYDAYGVPRDKPVFLPNVPDVEWLRSQPVDAAVQSTFADSHVILYYGSFGFNRGLDTAIRAMRQVQQEIPNARLVLVGPAIQGTESQQVEYLRRVTREEHLEGVVHFAGYLPENVIPTYINVADVGILPLNRTVHYESSLANKLFGYMALGKPVVVTDLRAQAAIVKEEKCGLVVPPQDPSALAKAIIRLNNDPKLATEMGQRGKRAIETKYNIRVAANDFLQMYLSLEKKIVGEEQQ